MAKRISNSSVNWSLVSDVLHGQERAAYIAFKTKSDSYLRQVMEKPAEIPTINWDEYKSKISVPGLVDSYKSSFEALKIPYPGDGGLLAKFDAKGAEIKAKHAKNMQMITENIKKLQEALVSLRKVLPYSEMSLEEFCEANPNYGFVYSKAKMWPQSLPDGSPYARKDH